MTTTIIAYPENAAYLYEKLTASPITGVSDADGVTGGAVFEDAAPEGVMGADDLWIEFEAQADGQDAAEVGEQRIWTETPFIVRAVMRGRDTKALKPIAKAIDDRLHRTSGTTTDGRIISCVRTQEHQDHWLEQGVEYRGLGGWYNLITQSLNP